MTGKPRATQNLLGNMIFQNAEADIQYLKWRGVKMGWMQGARR